MSGKTVFTFKLINENLRLIDPPPEEIHWFYGEHQGIFEQYKSRVTFHQGLEDMENVLQRNHKRKLVIIDDLMSETDKRVTSLFTRGCHHKNISVIYIVQNLFNGNKEQRTISLNSQYIVIFKNPRDSAQVAYLGRQMYPDKKNLLRDAYIDATSQPYGYLFIDLRQDTPDTIDYIPTYSIDHE